MRHQLVALAVSLAAVGGAFLSGSHRGGALIGTCLAGFTGLASICGMGYFAGAGPGTVPRALTVFAVAFFLRMVLVPLGTFAVVRQQESVVGFVVGFFVVYFVLAGIEGSYLHQLGRRTGSVA